MENDLQDEIEFQLYAKDCSSTSQERFPVRTYDTYGASPWEIIPDILKMYGMCSYHDWYEYLEFVDPADKVAHKNAGVCQLLGANSSAPDQCKPHTFDAHTSVWWDTQRPFAQPSMLTLYETRKFQVLCLYP